MGHDHTESPPTSWRYVPCPSKQPGPAHQPHLPQSCSLAGISAEFLDGAEGKTVFPLEDMSQ